MERSTNKANRAINVNERSPFWIDLATGSSIALGVAEAIVGLKVGGGNTVLANSVEMLDNGTYAIDSLASRNEIDRKKNHRLRRIAGSLICTASLYVAATSAYDLMEGHNVAVNPIFALFTGTATLVNGSYVLGLSKHAQDGTTHRDAFRHASADTISSAIATNSIILSAQGLPSLNNWTGLALSAWTILMTFPTKNRIESADQYFQVETDI